MNEEIKDGIIIEDEMQKKELNANQKKFIDESKEVMNIVNDHSKQVLNAALLDVGTSNRTADDYPNIPELKQPYLQPEPTPKEKFIEKVTSKLVTGGVSDNYEDAKVFMNEDFKDDQYTIRK